MNAVDLDASARTVRVVHEVTRCVQHMPLGACSVLESLALELYLKCLALLESGSHISEHDYLLLFADLRAETQKAIRDGWDAFLSSSPDWVTHLQTLAAQVPGVALSSDFDGMLKENAKAFEEWRYCHEWVGRKIIPWTAQHLVIIARRLVVGRKQEWAKHIRHLDPPQSTFIIR